MSEFQQLSDSCLTIRNNFLNLLNLKTVAMKQAYVSVKKQYGTGSGRVVTKDVMVPLQQAAAAADSDRLGQVVTYPFQQFPSNLFNNGGSLYSPTVQPGATQRIRHMGLRMQLTVANASVNLVPTPYWFRYIRVKNNATGEVLATFYNDTMLFNILASMKTKDQYQCMAKLINMDPDVLYGQGPATPVGTWDFYLPLTGSFFDNSLLFLALLKNDLQFEFTPESTGILASGTASNVTLANFQLIMSADRYQPDDFAKYAAMRYKDPYTCFYPDVVQRTQTSQTLTQAQQYLFDLTGLEGNVSHGFFLVRSTGVSNTNNGFMNLVSIGENSGTYDLQDQSGKSVWGGGTPIRWTQARNQIWAEHFTNALTKYKAFHFFTFADSICKSMKGEMCGYYPFKSSEKMFFAITPGPTYVNEVHTITAAAGSNTQGQYRISFRGELSNPLAYNANAATIKTAIEAMRNCLRDGITVTASAALGVSGGTLTIASNQIGTTGQDLFQAVGNVAVYATGATDTLTTTVTTSGNSGFTSGTYDITFYFYYYKRLTSFAGSWSTARVLEGATS